jgi:uncharacterized protein (DUF1778 family)
MKAKRFWSKRPLIHAAFRFSESERDLLRSAAMKAGVSLNDLIREAIKEKSTALLAREDSKSSLAAHL